MASNDSELPDSRAFLDVSTEGLLDLFGELPLAELTGGTVGDAVREVIRVFVIEAVGLLQRQDVAPPGLGLELEVLDLAPDRRRQPIGAVVGALRLFDDLLGADKVTHQHPGEHKVVGRARSRS